MEQIKEGQNVRTIYGIKRIDQFICGQDVRFDNTDGFDEYLLNYHNYDGISINSDEWKEIVIGDPKEKPIDLIEDISDERKEVEEIEKEKEEIINEEDKDNFDIPSIVKTEDDYITYHVHIVKNEETLEMIAMNYKINSDDLLKINNIIFLINLNY